jgi:hypothetical protein
MDIIAWVINQLPQPLKENPFHLVWILGTIFFVIGCLERINVNIHFISLEFLKLNRSLISFFRNLGITLIVVGIILVNGNQFSSAFKSINPSNFFSQNTSFSFSKSSLSTGDAFVIIKEYLDAQKEIFGESYNTEKLGKYVTGNLYTTLIGCNQKNCKNSIEWLRSNNAFFRFEDPNLRLVDSRTSIKAELNDEFSLEVLVSRSEYFIQNSKIIREKSAFNYCNKFIYTFKQENGNAWKISKIEPKEPCSQL